MFDKIKFECIHQTENPGYIRIQSTINYFENCERILHQEKITTVVSILFIVIFFISFQVHVQYKIVQIICVLLRCWTFYTLIIPCDKYT